MHTRTALVLVVASLALMACSTVKGIGQDVKQAGAAIERAANK